MLKKLRFKFVLINMSIVTVMLCVILGMIYNTTKTNLENDSIQMMKMLSGRPFKRDMPGAPDSGVKLPYFTLTIDMHGELIATGGGYFDLSDEEYLLELIDEASVSEERTGVLDEQGLRYYRADTPGNQYIVFTDISNEKAVLRDMLENSLLIGAVSFAAFLGISLLLARWAVKPVERAWRQQRQFVADASHELKTPLTVILINAELMQSGDYDEESRRRFSQSILAMSRQMRALVEQLLELARSDDARDKAQFAELDLSRLVSDCALPFEPLMFEKGLELNCEVAEGIRVSGEEPRLRQAVDILLDNAQKYSAAGGRVSLSLKKLGRGRCLLTVANTGAPIPEAELKNIFKRFYRADKARSSGGGFGLGLSIAESIVLRHRGRIWCESADGLNSFFIELPTLAEQIKSA